MFSSVLHYIITVWYKAWLSSVWWWRLRDMCLLLVNSTINKTIAINKKCLFGQLLIWIFVPLTVVIISQLRSQKTVKRRNQLWWVDIVALPLLDNVYKLEWKPVEASIGIYVQTLKICKIFLQYYSIAFHASWGHKPNHVFCSLELVISLITSHMRKGMHNVLVSNSAIETRPPEHLHP